MTSARHSNACGCLAPARRGTRLTCCARALVLGLGLALFAARLAAQPFAVTAWTTNDSVFPAFGTNATFRVRTDAGGNVFLGTTLQNLTFSNAELAVFKYSSTGGLLWRTTFDFLNAHRDHFLAGMEVDQAGNVYLAGTAAAGPGGGDWVVLKYDPAGTRLWSTNYGSSGFDEPVGLAVDERGFVAVAGNYAQGASIRAVRFDSLSGRVSGTVGVSPVIGTNRAASAMTMDAAGDVWVTGTSGTNCLTLRFAAVGPGLVYSGNALSPAALGPATGRAIAWSPTNNLVFVLAAAQTSSPPVRQIVLCYSNVSFPTVPLFTNWHAADPIPGTWLKPVIIRPSMPTNEDPVAIVIAPGGRVVTLAQAGTAYGGDWVVAGWDPAGNSYVETDSTLGPAGSLPTFPDLTAAGLAMDPDGNVIVTGTGRTAPQFGDFATVRFAPPDSFTPLARDWFHRYDFTNSNDQAQALAVDVTGNVLVTGPSQLFGNFWLSTIKVAQGPPLNDQCSTALHVREGTVAFSTLLATDTTPPVSPCGADGRDVWFLWTAPASGLTEIDTFGSLFDTVLSVYTGDCGALTPVPGACNDNAVAGRPIGTLQSFVSFSAQAGTNYWIQVGAASPGLNGGDGRLTIFGPLPSPGTCPPGVAPLGRWRKFLVQGNGTSAGGGVWRLTVPGCSDVFGLAATSIGASPSVLASNLALSINAACGPAIRAVAVTNTLFVQVKGCPPDEPVFFRLGSPGTPLNQLCLLADAPPSGSLFPVTPPTCSYNPTLAAQLGFADCNGNGVPDEVDIASGVSQDTNNNQIPDECEGGLNMRPAGNQGVVFWGVQGYALLSSTNLVSPASWITYSTTSPAFVPFTNSAQYFRLQAAP
jgi:hypothetical protein